MDLVIETGLQDAKASSFPIPKGLSLEPDQGTHLSNPYQYQRLIGKLLYINLTRPNISYAVQHLSQFMTSPCQPHLDAAL